MATGETRRDRGDRVARQLLGRLLGEIRTARTVSNLSMRTVATELGWSHARYVELETRVRDVQKVVRKMRERERDGGADRILMVLSASAHNRRVLPELLDALGPEFATSPRSLLKALREGRAIPGSGVILL